MKPFSPTQEEQQLLTSFQNGDQQAFNQLFRKFYPSLCFFANRMLDDKALTEEIVGDVFFKLWDKHSSFSSIPAIKAFLYISTRNASLNAIEKEQTKRRNTQQFAHQYSDVEQPVIQEIILSEVINELRHELTKLPAQCAKVMKMLYEDEMKPQEIADQLDITVSTVYNQKLRAISVLKKRIASL